jgi:hypothetical protein
MADTAIEALSNGTTANATDRFPATRDPTGTPANVYLTPAYIEAFMQARAQVWSPPGHITEFRNGTSPQIVRVYNTYTDSSNYERGFVRYNSNVLEIGHESAGTGSGARSIRFITGANTYMFSGDNIQIAGSAITLNNSRDLSFIGTFAGRVLWSDVALLRSAAGVLNLTNASTGGAALEFREQTAPSAAAANSFRLYAQDNGSGKTQAMIIFASGAAQQIAIEP